MTAQLKLDMILAALERGKTVTLCTPLRQTVITPKTWKSWERSGHALLKVSDSGSLRLAEGRRYVSADYVDIRVSD